MTKSACCVSDRATLPWIKIIFFICSVELAMDIGLLPRSEPILFIHCTTTVNHFIVHGKFTYSVLFSPEIIKMTELNDNPELSALSSGILLMLSSITPPRGYIELILNEMIISIMSSLVSFIRIWHNFLKLTFVLLVTEDKDNSPPYNNSFLLPKYTRYIGRM